MKHHCILVDKNNDTKVKEEETNVDNDTTCPR